MRSKVMRWRGRLVGVCSLGWVVGCGTGELPLPAPEEPSAQGPAPSEPAPQQPAPQEPAAQPDAAAPLEAPAEPEAFTGAMFAHLTLAPADVASSFVARNTTGPGLYQGSVTAGSGSSASALFGGSYELEAYQNGELIARANYTLPTDQVKQVVILSGGTRRNPLLRVDDVDVSAPAAGLRRARVTNALLDEQPIQLFFYNAQDARIAESPSIAPYETWRGTVPADAVGFRLSPTEPQTTPLGFVNDMMRPGAEEIPLDPPCLEAPAFGVAITGRFQTINVAGAPRQGVPYVVEMYRLSPPRCAPPVEARRPAARP